MKMAQAVMAPADLTAARIGEIAAGGAQPGSAAPGPGVRLGPELLAGVQRQCERARAALRRGHRGRSRVTGPDRWMPAPRGRR